jgi:hypothetical protein
MDEHAWRKCWHAQGDRLIAKLALALVEPAEQVPARLQKLDAVADQGEGVWGVPEEVSGGSNPCGIGSLTSRVPRVV